MCLFPFLWNDSEEFGVLQKTKLEVDPPKIDTTAIRQPSIGKPSISQPLFRQLYIKVSIG